jgi:polyhydroxyalkanoate synthesis regulator phasin
MERLQAAKDKELQETRAIIDEQRREIQKMKEIHQREIATQKLLVDEVRRQHAISQEQVDNKLYHIEQQMRLRNGSHDGTIDARQYTLQTPHDDK